MNAEMDWKQAENYLNMLIAEYTAIGWTGCFALWNTLVPLKQRLNAGERSKALYDEIMECE